MKRMIVGLMLGLSLAASADSLLDTSQANLFGAKPIRVGDLVTVNIGDRVTNSQIVDVKSESQMNLQGPIGGGLLSFFGPAIDLQGNGNNSRKEGSVAKSEFSQTVTARVEAIENDQLVLVARNKLEIDGKLREISLKGRVRRQDVTAQNTVPSDRIADAEVFVEGTNSSPVPGGLMSFIMGLLR